MVLALVAPLLGSTAHAAGPSPTAEDARFALALYCNPTCDAATVDALEAGLASIDARDSFGEVATRPIRIMGMAGPEFGMPDTDFISAYGVDVDRPEALAGAQEVLLAWFAAPRPSALSTFVAAHAAFAEAARVSGGWVEDLDTQTVYGAAAWAAKDPKGPLTDWFVVDAEPADSEGNGPYRMVTRGLRRFGESELVVPDVSGDAAGDVGFVLNAVATRLHELGRVDETLTLATDDVRGTATFTAIAAVESDPEPPLIRVSFKGEIGPRPTAPDPLPEPEPVAALAVPVTPAAPTAAPAATAPATGAATAPAAAAPKTLDEARAAALARLDGPVRAAWEKGLPAGDKLAVSAPFVTSKGGTEYIWVELRSWEGGRMAGVLANAPYDVPNLAKGDRVDVSMDDVFDYVWRHADGSREGNTTAAFLKR